MNIDDFIKKYNLKLAKHKQLMLGSEYGFDGTKSPEPMVETREIESIHDIDSEQAAVEVFDQLTGMGYRCNLLTGGFYQPV